MQEIETRSRNKLNGQVKDEVGLGLGLTLSTKDRSGAAREESQKTERNENCRQSAKCKQYREGKRAKSLLDQSSEGDRKTQQAWQSNIQPCVDLKCGVPQF